MHLIVYYCVIEQSNGFSYRVRDGKLVLLFLNQNICCGYLNGPIKWGGSFEDQKHTIELIDNDNIKISML